MAEDEDAFWDYDADNEVRALREALQAIIDRSYNDPLGTSKVIDMRKIAEAALNKA